MKSHQFHRTAWRDAALVGALTVMLSSCGGGRSDAPAPTAPAPAPVPPPPPTPPSVDASRVTVTPQPLPSDCATLPGCVPSARIVVDNDGQSTAVWAERPPAGGSRIMATSFGALANRSTVEVESVPSVPRDATVYVYPVSGALRVAVAHRYGTSPSTNQDPYHLRLVEFSTLGQPVAWPRVTPPASLQWAPAYPMVTQDAVGQMYTALGGQINPMPPFDAVNLGGGVQLRGFALPVLAVDWAQFYGDFHSFSHVQPRTLFSGIATLRNGATEVHAMTVDLTTGTVQSGQRIAPAASQRNQQVACTDEPSFVTRLPETTYIVAWRQLNARGDGCDFMVNERRLNAEGRTVMKWAMTASPTETIAVWNERDPATGATRILWSRRPSGAADWTPPASIAPDYAASGDAELMLQAAAAPWRTLAVAWSNRAPTVSGQAAYLSKYVNGRWLTSSGGTVDGFRDLSVSEAGRAVALFRSDRCSGAPCEELYALPF